MHCVEHVAPEQANGTHVTVFAPQAPSPLHSNTLATPSEHVPVWQVVPADQNLQEPIPLQLPSVPHVDWACAAQSLSGSEPSTAGPHAPLLPLPFFAALHARQGPEHAVSQQYPSTQLPVAHCDALVHAAPLAWSGWHVLSDARQ